MDADENKDGGNRGRAVRGKAGQTAEEAADSLERQRIRYEDELRRAGIDVRPTNEIEDANRPKCYCCDNPIMRNSCDYNSRLMSSSMGVFQISTFLLLIQAFCVDMCIGSYLTWYPTVMYDTFNQGFVYSSLQMAMTGMFCKGFEIFVMYFGVVFCFK